MDVDKIVIVGACSFSGETGVMGMSIFAASAILQSCKTSSEQSERSQTLKKTAGKRIICLALINLCDCGDNKTGKVVLMS